MKMKRKILAVMAMLIAIATTSLGTRAEAQTTRTLTVSGETFTATGLTAAEPDLLEDVNFCEVWGWQLGWVTSGSVWPEWCWSRAPTNQAAPQPTWEKLASLSQGSSGYVPYNQRTQYQARLIQVSGGARIGASCTSGVDVLRGKATTGRNSLEFLWEICPDSHNERRERVDVEIYSWKWPGSPRMRVQAYITNTGIAQAKMLEVIGRKVSEQVAGASSQRLKTLMGTPAQGVGVWGEGTLKQDSRSFSIGVDYSERNHTVGVGVSRVNVDDAFLGVEFEAEMDVVHPYGAYRPDEDTQVWGVIGAGKGNMDVVIGDQRYHPDLDFTMVAVGVDRKWSQYVEIGGSAKWFRTSSDSASNADGQFAAEDSQGNGVRGYMNLTGNTESPVVPYAEIGWRNDKQLGSSVDAELGIELDWTMLKGTVAVQRAFEFKDEWSWTASLGANGGWFTETSGQSLAFGREWDEKYRITMTNGDSVYASARFASW